MSAALSLVIDANSAQIRGDSEQVLRRITRFRNDARMAGCLRGDGAIDLARYRSQVHEEEYRRWIDRQPPTLRRPLLAQLQDGAKRFLGALARDGAKRADGGNVPGLDAYRKRMDNFGVNAGFFLARELEFRMAEMLREVVPGNTFFQIFQRTPGIKPGAAYFSNNRLSKTLAAAVHKSGQNVPRSTLSRKDERFPIRQLVSGFSWTIFEERAADFAGIGYLAEGLRTPIEAIYRLANRIGWQGMPQAGLYGVLNHPFLPKMVFDTAFTSASTGEQIFQALMAFWTSVSISNYGALPPTDLVISDRLAAVAARRYINVGGVNQSAWMLFKEQAIGMGKIHLAHELRDVGGTGVDAMLACRLDGSNGITYVMPQGPTALPQQQHEFDKDHIMWSDFGGVYIPNPLGQKLGLIEVDTADVI